MRPFLAKAMLHWWTRALKNKMCFKISRTFCTRITNWDTFVCITMDRLRFVSLTQERKKQGSGAVKITKKSLSKRSWTLWTSKLSNRWKQWQYTSMQIVQAQAAHITAFLISWSRVSWPFTRTFTPFISTVPVILTRSVTKRKREVCSPVASSQRREKSGREGRKYKRELYRMSRVNGTKLISSGT